MPFGGLLTAGILGATGVIGSAISNKKSNRQQVPVTSPEYVPLRDLLLQQQMSRLQGGTQGISDAYKYQGLQNLAATGAAGEGQIKNWATGAGLSTSPAYLAAMANLGTSQRGATNDYLNIQLPQLVEGVQNNRLASAQQLLGVGQGVQLPGSAAGSALGTGAELLAYLYGSGRLGGSSPMTSATNAGNNAVNAALKSMGIIPYIG